MKNKFLILLNLVVLLAAGYAIYRSMKIPDVKYVRSADLVYSFEGMKEAQHQQEQKTSETQANVDTLQMDFQKAVNRYNMDYPKLSQTERAEREKLLSIQQNNLKQYSQNAEQKLKDADNQVTQGVLNQVNSFVEEYAKKKSYDIVLGTTTSGNILYAKDYMDITAEVLKELNEEYKSGTLKQ